MVKRLLLVMILGGVVALSAPVHADWLTGFEAPDYNGSAAGTLLTGQQGWYLPVVCNDYYVYTYAGNPYGIVQNPEGGEQFIGGESLGAYARTQHDYDWSANDSWKVTIDVATLYTGTLPTTQNLGSFSLQPSTTARYWQYLLTWVDLNTADQFHAGYLTAESGGVSVFPGPEWQNLPVNHWYRLTTTFRLYTNLIIECSIQDLTDGGPEIVVQPTGWHLLLGTSPNPTAMRCFSGGTTVGNVCAWDNLSIVLGPPPPVGACCHGADCTIDTQMSCETGGGTYMGDDSPCTPNPCTGACCFDFDVVCIDDFARDECLAQGGRYTAGTLCANIDPPCGTGACCYTDPNGMQCGTMLPADCVALQGMFQGPLTTCDPNPCVGACCRTDGPGCQDGLTELECLALGWLYAGGGTTCFPNPCPPPNDLCGNAIVVDGPYPVTLPGQTTHGATLDTDCSLGWPATWYLINNPYTCADITVQFCPTSVNLATMGIVYVPDCTCNGWVAAGFYSFQVCPNGFLGGTLRFFGFTGTTMLLPTYLIDSNLAGVDFDLTITVRECLPVPANDLCENATVVDGPYPVTLTDQTTLGATPDCPTVLNWRATWYQLNLPYACQDVSIEYCPTSFDLYTAGIVYVPDCTCVGWVGGSYTWQTCPSSGHLGLTLNFMGVTGSSVLIPAYLIESSGDGLDFDVKFTVTECPPPCDPAVCPPGSVLEGEPDCYDEYLDTTNGGCNSSPYVFGSIACSQTICGTSGTYLFGGASYRDTDWYQIETTQAGTLTLTVCASFPVQLLVLGPADPTTCSYTNSWVATSPALRPATLTTPVLDPGIYWCWIGPSVYSGVPCGSPYWATVTGGVCSAYPCATTPGDLNDDTLVNGDDLQGFVDCVLAGISEPCGCADINGDGAVDLNDVTPFVNLLVGP